MMEIVNYATWDNPFTMFEIMGFGKAEPEPVAPALPGLHRPGVGSGHRAGRRRHRPRARRDRRAPRGHPRRRATSRSRRAPSRPAPSRACASRSAAWSAARSASSSSTSPACATRTPPTGRRASGYRIHVDGEPNVHLELALSSDRRRPQPRRLPGHRHARDQRHPPRGGGRARRAHLPRPPRVLGAGHLPEDPAPA